MWNELYLETCCRSALHRLMLAGPVGRPGELKDGPCLVRLREMGLACERVDRRFEATEAGAERHSVEVVARRDNMLATCAPSPSSASRREGEDRR